MKKDEFVNNIISKYCTKMVFLEKGSSLLRLYVEKYGVFESEWEGLCLSVLASFSEMLFLHLYSNPDNLPLFFEMTKNRDFFKVDNLKDKLLKSLVSTTKDISDVLNSFRLTALSAIAVMDFLNLLDFEEVTLYLSNLTDAIVTSAIYISEHKTIEKFGIPYYEGNDGKLYKSDVFFFALGKWGGKELNYSSDIDIIAIYERDGKTDFGFKNQTFFDKWAESSYTILSSKSLSLSGFKVDFNLRPWGKDGTLTIPLESALKYYERESQFWEKQSWIKARTIYGNFSKGEDFILKMHNLLNKNNDRKFVGSEIEKSRKKTISSILEPSKNIKEGIGSIRDIEFALQGLLITSSQNGEKIENNSIKALNYLKSKKIISEEEEKRVSDSYKILRKCEHFVQIVNLRQCHYEVTTEKEWNGLSKYLGVDDAKDILKRSRIDARKFFEEKIDFLKKEGSLEYSFLEDLKREISNSPYQKKENIFFQLSKVFSLLLDEKCFSLNDAKKLKNEILKSNEKEVLRALQSFEPIIVNLVEQKGIKPDLQKITEIFSLLKFSKSLAEYLKSFPELVFTDKEEVGDLSKKDIKDIALLQKRLFLEWIKEEIFYGDDDFLKRYTQFAEKTIIAILQKVEEEFRFGKITIFGLGRLGTSEMLFKSDLDLIFVTSSNNYNSLRFASEKCARAFLETISSLTRYGTLYDVDVRLRPYGSQGSLVVCEDALLNYMKKDARLWELLTYTKLRFIAGDKKLGESIQKRLLDSVEITIDTRSLQVVSTLIKKLHKLSFNLEGMMKFKKGGLFHQDLFLTSFALKRKFPLMNIGTFNFIDLLYEEKEISFDEATLLKEARQFFLKNLYRIRIESSLFKKENSLEDMLFAIFDEDKEERLREEVVKLINCRFKNLL